MYPRTLQRSRDQKIKMVPTLLIGRTLNNVSALSTALDTPRLARAVDNALTLFRVWLFKNVGAIFGHASAAAYAQRSG